jgi:hypothetical protein
MNNILLSAGIACVVAAVVGGGCKAFGIEIPGIKSVSRQVLLGLVGIALIVLSRSPFSPSFSQGSQSNSTQAIGTDKLPVSDPGASIPPQEQSTVKEPQPAKEPTQQDADVSQGVWRDPEPGGLMWTRNDNGSDITWYVANGDYCQNLGLAGYSDWKLPTVHQLQQITATQAGGDGGLRLSSNTQWSNERGDGVTEAWEVFFSDGHKRSISSDFDSKMRALCVRHP